MELPLPGPEREEWVKALYLKYGVQKGFLHQKDPRITSFGRFLRTTSLDELPQLWNKYTLKQRRRLDVKPGIIGIWQVGGRSDVPFQEQVQLDLKYIESQSLWLDFLLLLSKIPRFFTKGYSYDRN